MGGVSGTSFEKGLFEMSIKTEPVTMNVGPIHPSTHGVFRMRVTFDGEEIIDVEPVIGYLHRGSEKLAEEPNPVDVPWPIIVVKSPKSFVVTE